MNFEPGDKAICIINTGCRELKIGKEYQINMIYNYDFGCYLYFKEEEIDDIVDKYPHYPYTMFLDKREFRSIVINSFLNESDYLKNLKNLSRLIDDWANDVITHSEALFQFYEISISLNIDLDESTIFNQRNKDFFKSKNLIYKK